MTIWIGLDPSIAAFGYAVLGAEPHQKLEVIDVGTWHTRPDSGAQKRDDRARRILELGRKLKALLQAYQPRTVAIESPVLGMRDGKVAVHVAARVRGMVEGLVVGFNFGLVEYTPQAVKKSMTGRNDASKEEVAMALARTYDLSGLELDDNATDALAVANLAARRMGLVSMAVPSKYSPTTDAGDDLDF